MSDSNRAIVVNGIRQDCGLGTESRGAWALYYCRQDCGLGTESRGAWALYYCRSRPRVWDNRLRHRQARANLSRRQRERYELDAYNRGWADGYIDN